MALSGELEEFRNEFAEFTPRPCKSSEAEYYVKQYEKSYKIRNDTRGAALVVCMTEDRPGWIHDARIVRDVFRALNFEAGIENFIFDPVYEELKQKLREFATREENETLDCVFVVFMGHGGQIGTDICVKLKGDEDSSISLFEECSLIFTRQRSRLRDKPKAFIVQSCRSRALEPSLPVKSPGYDDDCVDLRHAEPLSSFTDYFFCNATEQGSFATRDPERGSPFIQKFLNKLHQHSHSADLEGVFKATLREDYKEKDTISPQILSSAYYKLNLFPGITREIVENISGTAESTAAQRDSEMAATSETSAEECMATIRISVSSKTKQGTIRKFLSEKESLSDDLSEEVDGKIDVLSVKEKCIIIEILIYGHRTLERLKYMSDKNILTKFFRGYVSKKAKGSDVSGCGKAVNSVRLELTKGEKQFVRKLQMTDIFVGIGDDIKLLTPSGDIDKTTAWKKDDHPLRWTTRINLKKRLDGRVMLVIERAEALDGGIYSCTTTSRENASDKMEIICVVHVDESPSMHKAGGSGKRTRTDENQDKPGPPKRSKKEATQVTFAPAREPVLKQRRDERLTAESPKSHPDIVQDSMLSEILWCQVFNDPVHGPIEMHPLCIKVIDTPQFQRLRYIKQLGGCYLVFPGASHSRFEHALGAAWLARKFTENLRSKQPSLNITDEDVLCVTIAGLCHDLGQGPFSNVFEKLFIPKVLPGRKWKFEEASVEMFRYLIEENDLVAHFKEYGLDDKDITFIEELMVVSCFDNSEDEWVYKGRGKEKSFLFEIVNNHSSGIGVKTWDHLARDCHYLGIKNNFDYRRFMKCSSVRIVGGRLQICSRDKVASDLHDMFHDAAMLRRKATFHKTTKIAELMLSEAFVKADPYLEFQGKDGRRLKMSETIDDMPAYLTLDDTIFQQIVRSSSPELEEARIILDMIQRRRLFKFVGQTQPSGSYRITEAMVPEMKTKLLSICEALSDADETEAAKLQPEDLVFEVLEPDLGMGTPNPFDNVTFYMKSNPEVTYHFDMAKVSQMLPRQFMEQQLRVYCRQVDETSVALAVRGFREWCDQTHNFSKAKGGDVLVDISST